jgi:CheY-like chemotaxis protein
MVALILALVEHSEHVEQVRSSLEDVGHEVSMVDSFATAKTVLEEHSFDLVISDVHLENGGSVFDFLKWCKTHRRIKSIPFVLFSLEPTPRAKYLADGVRSAARYMGAATYICMETFDAQLLQNAIAEFLPSRD